METQCMIVPRVVDAYAGCRVLMHMPADSIRVLSCQTRYNTPHGKSDDSRRIEVESISAGHLCFEHQSVRLRLNQTEKIGP
jgi:hypothetical protein